MSDGKTVIIDEATQKNIDQWLSGDYDEATKNEIKRLQRENPNELIDAFYTKLEFGTGGLRGVMGVGSNRMNVYTVRAASQGFANYLHKQNQEMQKLSLLIGYDCRHNSKLFAKESAKVFAANNIEVFIYEELRPVPLVSFGLMYKNCTAGIMVTASHNPPEYNGYKAYWSNGAQVLPPHDEGIIEEVNKITHLSQVKETSIDNPLIHWISDEIDQAYLKAIHNYQLFPEDNKLKGSKIKVIYTSLHGAGITMVPKALNDWGFTNVTIVEEQKEPNGDFPTVSSPNPEEKAALKIGIEKLVEQKGDILIGTDPDTDRMGVVVMHQRQPILLNGNQIACLCLEHLCESLSKTGFPNQPTFIKTIVTSELFKAICDSYQTTSLDVLTGFKYIGEKIDQWAKEKTQGKKSPTFIFGGEESYGYLLGTHARDKDAVVSAALITEAALHQKLQNKTLIDLLYSIYSKHGIYREKLQSIVYKGKEGVEKMTSMMNHLRKNPPKTFLNMPVVKMEDYSLQECTDLSSGKKDKIDLPKSNVLRFWLHDQTKIVVRPSGTEPKIKLYCGTILKEYDSLEKGIVECDQKLDRLLEELTKFLA